MAAFSFYLAFSIFSCIEDLLSKFIIIKLIFLSLFILSIRLIKLSGLSKFLILKDPMFCLKVINLKFLKFEVSSKLNVTKVSLVTDLPKIDDINSVFLKINKMIGIKNEYIKR